ncbi:helix-turn-helix transcriptional regulator [Glaciimonas sp. CA11.2]|uniref:AraC family transcriptional regulator n=1 Tax=unclassified Glaciimonas TaxID=2644401 RepID=UPI002AB47FEE|nr:MULTISPECIES: helix-turn-helix transcriptional regulator [unclassified Glaciimonas]MDY7548151.1 helix-turn-helix transcriptional regulator [Glaciimonas sp. CA11.2]MEB0010342.1 helix-turn-helix transcriptional regulator [Glaciimonas sp. Cout2]MEB0084763.1 helix-turn-helix transcriptional regulator [Glaciimonas sp. Gout2]MEB0164696.1 helix-turn-helix transcriptional regulator [Glaciimonas sp. CA11.2]
MNDDMLTGAPIINLFGEPPAPVWLRRARFKAGTVFPQQRRSWGRLLYAVKGVAEFDVAGERYLSPPAYAIWIPPEVTHASRANLDIEYVVVHIESDRCVDMPTEPCTLALSDVTKALVTDLTSRGIGHPRAETDLRMVQVIIDQLIAAQRYASYLPATDDPLLSPIIATLELNPGDRRSLAQWADESSSTERTLSRRWHAHLFMSYNEWRQRLRLVKAINMLEAGNQVKEIAYTLGYQNTSAFIEMYRRRTGTTPGGKGKLR